MSNGNPTNQNDNLSAHSGSGPTQDSRSNQPTPLPDNLWGFLGFCVKAMGNFAKPLIIVAAIGVGIYLFIDEYQTRDKAIQDARKIAEDQYQQRLKDAEIEKDRVYQVISELSQKQITTVKELLELQEKSGTYIEKEMQRFEGLRQKADEQITRAEEAQNETDRLTVEAADLEKKKVELQNELSKQQEHLNQTERQLKDKGEALNKRIGELEDWKDKYITFVQEFLALADDPSNTSDLTGTRVYEIATGIRREYFPENLSRTRIRWLNEFAAHPDAKSITTLQQLVGAKQEEMEKMLRETTDFKVWTKATLRFGEAERGDEKEEIFYYLGATKWDDYGWYNGVFIQGVDGKVVDVLGVSWISIVRLPSPMDWFTREYYVVGNDFKNLQLIPLGRDYFGGKGNWSYGKALIATESDENVPLTYELISGKDKEFSFIPYEELLNRDPNFNKTMLVEEEDFAENVNMYEKSKRFDESYILFREGVSLPIEVHKFFTKLLVGLVKNDEKVYTSLLDRNIDASAAGKMAATALKKNFKVVHFESLSARNEMRQMAVQSNAPGVTGEPERYNIFCEYQTSATDSRNKIARFSIARAVSGFGWVVVHFSEEERATQNR
ncbi:MAG: hypothetical protein GY845_16915 [Planctomycetes bacterium]|nr:hypothetical protein [Planctomycetota bacterium]